MLTLEQIKEGLDRGENIVISYIEDGELRLQVINPKDITGVDVLRILEKDSSLCAFVGGGTFTVKNLFLLYSSLISVRFPALYSNPDVRHAAITSLARAFNGVCIATVNLEGDNSMTLSIRVASEHAEKVQQIVNLYLDIIK